MLLTLAVGCTHEPSTSLSDNDQEAATVTTVTASTTLSTPSTIKSKDKNTTKAKTTTKTKTKKTTAEKTKAPTATPTTAPTRFYTEIKTRAVGRDEFQQIALHPDGETVAMHIDIPADWTLQQNTDGGWDIVRNKQRIGTVGCKKPPAAKAQYAAQYTDHDGYTFAQMIRTADNADGFEWMLAIMHPTNTAFHTVYMTVSYSELSAAAVKKMLADCVVVPDRSNVTPQLLKSSNGSNKIAILGNSFVSTSGIGNFLEAFIDAGDKPYQTVASSIGYANVGTYGNSAAWMSRLRSGEFAVVFLCGFYSDYSVLFTQIQQACDQSDTKLVIFPAHNESASAISAVKENNPDAFFLLWKNEIDALIADGVSYNLFCINDQHQHSTPLAGYVGAHMIYRSLFGEVPPRTDNAPLSAREVRTKLGDTYMDTGVVKQDTIIDTYICS